MKRLALVAFSVIPLFCSAQIISDDQLMLNAADEGMNNVQITNLVDYFHSKSFMQPSQRNAAPVSTQAMTNPGFESGDFTGWNGTIGDNNISMYSPLSNQQNGIFSTTVNAPLNDASARHTIMTGNDTDYYGQFPVISSSGGNYVARLGGTTPNYQGEVLQQTWTVDLSQLYVKVRYAVVLNNAVAGHAYDALPYFYYVLLDANGHPIATDTLVASDTSLTLSIHPDPNIGDPVYFRPWSTDSISLLSYVGQNVTLVFSAAGCTQSGHFGYAYLDVFDPFTASIDENSVPGFSVSPNPATDHVDLNGKIISASDISVFNMFGQSVNFTATGNESSWRLDLSGLKSGIYFISVRDGNTVSDQKVIVNGND